MLSESQINVIKSLVSNKDNNIGKISQRTGMHRHSVKIILNKLIELGFVVEKKQGNKYNYEAIELSKIKQYYLSKLNSNRSEISSLKSDYEATKDTQIVNVLNGKNGLRSVLVDEIIKGKEICAFNLWKSKFSSEFEEELKANDERRKELKIPLRIITSSSLSSKPLSEIKKTDLKSNIDMFLYGNKLTLIYHNNEETIYTMKINEITKLHKDIFENKWKVLK